MRGKIDRCVYTDTIKAIRTIVRGFQLWRNIGDADGLSFNRPEIFCEEILKMLSPEYKCRVVVEYDPAEEKVSVYQEPMERMKTPEELRAIEWPA